MRIAGATVLVTGAAGGIGGAVARRLAAEGAALVVSGRRPEAVEPLAAELGARVVAADLADREQLEHLARECRDVDILVANAALPGTGDLLDYTPEQIDRALDVNLRAPVMLARLLAPRLREAGRGHLVFVGSMSGKAATQLSTLYTGTKFGLRGFSHSLRLDLRASGVGVSLVQPGYVRDAGMFAAAGEPVPGGAPTVTPEQVAAAVVRAVERDLGEVNVAPLRLRLLCALAGQFPSLAERGGRPARTQDVVRRIAEAQRERR
ncbi:SDR family NAD(P)-dependent oxidoreductase [Streptomyces mayteni]